MACFIILPRDKCSSVGGLSGSGHLQLVAWVRPLAVTNSSPSGKTDVDCQTAQQEGPSKTARTTQVST